MNILYALLLGIIQGLTEFIPVSSTAHLLITQNLLGIPADSATFSFLVIVQLGTLVSLFIFYWQDLLKIAQSVLQFLPSVTKPRDTWKLTPDTWLGIYIILATIPALLAGYLLKDAVEALFRQPMLQASMRLFAAAILLSLAERFSRKDRQLEQMNWLDALVIGIFQVIAVFPGASRSGTTISGGMFRGFDRPSAARFAFLMSIPVMLAAGAYEMIDVLQMPDLGAFLPLLAVGFVSAAITGWFAIRWLIAFLGKRSLYGFAIYCALVGSACMAAYLL
ncbi:MAG: undecaprenyl-diphosphatase UppP [Chloroflexi bacterium HGW-Chloroflexi-6]|nr:MAG: undecaprenyl-diphosphatase UppP [Chloroflexi bacterium HGW-Chloroflexi-6]